MRLTEFVDYINSKTLDEEKIDNIYSHLTVDEKIEKVRNDYLKKKKMMPCEMCDNYEGKKREDNIYVCDKCEKEHPSV